MANESDLVSQMRHLPPESQLLAPGARKHSRVTSCSSQNGIDVSRLAKAISDIHFAVGSS